jgi:hypothetical protein
MKRTPKLLLILLGITLIITILPITKLTTGQDIDVTQLVNQIQSAGLNTSVDNDSGQTVVTVTGWNLDASTTLTLNIVEGVTVKWNAYYFGSPASGSLINFNGNGTFEIGPGGYIYNDGTGTTINAAGAKVVVTGTSNAACGIVEADSGSAIVGSGPNTVVIVEGFGTVFGDERSNLHPVVSMNNPSNTGDNVFVKGHGSVWAVADATLGYAIQTYGNVVMDGGDVSSVSYSGRAINLIGKTSIATINGGKIHVDGGASSVAISTANTNATSVSHASVYVNGGTVSATAGFAIRTSGANSTINVTGGTVSATTGNAIRTEGGANVSITVSGGFVFAYGTTISGANNVIHRVNNGALDIIAESVIVAWNLHSVTPPCRCIY